MIYVGCKKLTTNDNTLVTLTTKTAFKIPNKPKTQVTFYNNEKSSKKKLKKCPPKLLSFSVQFDMQVLSPVKYL